MFRFLKNISIEAHPRISLLCAYKGHTVCSNAVRHGCREGYCLEASVHCYFCWKKYITSAYWTTISQYIFILHNNMRWIFCSRYAGVTSEKCCSSSFIWWAIQVLLVWRKVINQEGICSQLKCLAYVFLVEYIFILALFLTNNISHIESQVKFLRLLFRHENYAKEWIRF